MIYKNSAGRRVTVPFHAQKTLHPKLLKSILGDADINVVDLEKLL
jgi:predicted RNA binding protein YcfA (HicA-like mRNA interferase family)